MLAFQLALDALLEAHAGPVIREHAISTDNVIAGGVFNCATA
jgi:hypothetical protein